MNSKNQMWMEYFFIFILCTLAKRIGVDFNVHPRRWVPHDNSNMHEGVMYLLRVGAPLVGLRVRWMGEAVKMGYVMWMNNRQNVGQKVHSLVFVKGGGKTR